MSIPGFTTFLREVRLSRRGNRRTAVPRLSPRLRRREWCVAASAAFLLSLFPDAGWPKEQGEFALGQPGEGFSYGRLTLHPFLNLGFTYDTNLFLEDTDPQDDFIAVISPGIQLEFPWDQNLFRLTYRPDIIRYVRYPEVNDVNQFVSALFDYYFYKHSLALQDVFLRTYTREGTEFIQLIKRYENTASARLSQYFNQYILTIGYQNFWQHFITEGYEVYDHQEHTGALSGRYKLSPKLRALIEYEYTYIDYEQRDLNRNGYFNQVLGGIEGQFTSKLSGTAKIGYQAREYESPLMKDFDGLVGFISLTQMFSSRSRLDFGWERTVRESTYTDNNYFTINRAWLHYEQQLGYKLTGILELAFRNHRYPSPSSEAPDRRRNDDIWRLTAELKYPIQRWLSVAGGYTFLTRDSNLPGEDYDDHRVTMRIETYY